ncbi:MAG: SRPBCC domain-containing protein [Devosia sp.]
MTETIEAKVTHRFKASPERVYDAFLDPVKVRLWQKAWGEQAGSGGEMTACEINPVVGGKFLFADMRAEGEARHWGTFKTLERPKKIAFTWYTDPSEEDQVSLVTLIIEPEPDGPGAVVTLYHEMGAQWVEWIKQTEKGWITMLQAIDGMLLAEG